jgi:hypothetical protein
MAEPPTRFRWLRAHELKINLILAVGALVFFVSGILLGQGLIAGPALILLIFFSIYSIYAYQRRDARS